MADTTPERVNPFQPFDPTSEGEITPDVVQKRLDHLLEVGTRFNGYQPLTRNFGYKLTEKQRRYGQRLLVVGPDRWKEAAVYAGYSPTVMRVEIEKSPALADFLAALKYETALHAAITIQSVGADLVRLGAMAEMSGDYGVAVRAAKLQGDMVGAFKQDDKAGGAVNVEGNLIVIESGRSQKDADATDATYREVIDLNEESWKAEDQAALPEQAGQ